MSRSKSSMSWSSLASEIRSGFRGRGLWMARWGWMNCWCSCKTWSKTRIVRNATLIELKSELKRGDSLQFLTLIRLSDLTSIGSLFIHKFLFLIFSKAGIKFPSLSSPSFFLSPLPAERSEILPSASSTCCLCWIWCPSKRVIKPVLNLQCSNWHLK